MKNKVLKAGIWYTACNFLVKGLSFLTMPIFTRMMTKDDIGLFSNITSWVSILAIVTTFEIYSSVSIARFDYKKDLNSYISSSLVLGTLITSIFYAIALIFHGFFEELFVIDFQTLNIIFIYLLVYPSIQMFQIKNQITYNYKSTVFISLLSAILSTGISVALVVLMQQNPLEGRILGYFIPLIILSLTIYILLLIRGKKISTKYWKYALKISFPLIWHLLAGYLLSSADKIMITKMISPDANALYSVAYTVSISVSILWSSMNNAWSPWAYSMMDEKKYDQLKTKSKPYTIFFLLVVSILILLAPELLLIMGGSEYTIAKYIIPPVMAGYIFQFIYSLYVNIEFYHKKQTKIAIGTIIAALANIILNAIFIPIFGYEAAAYTTLAGYILLFIIHYLFVKRLGCAKWYDSKFFIGVSIFTIILMLLSLFSYSCTIFRFSLLGLIIIFAIIYVFKKKNIIIDIIGNKKSKKPVSKE